MKPETLKIYPNRRREYAAAEMLIYVFYLSRSVILPFWGSIKDSYIALAIPVLFSFYLYFRRLREARELRLLALYWLWYIISRFICKANTIIYALPYYMDLSLMITFCTVGFVLDKEERSLFFNCLTAVACGFFFILGCMGIYTVLTRQELHNPFTGQVISSLRLSGNGLSQLTLLETYSTIVASWYLMCILIMAVQFFKCKRKLWRVPICLAGLVFYLTIAFTHCRNAQVAFSGCLAMLLILLALRGMKLRGAARKALAVVLISAVTLPLGYKSFDVTTGIVTRLYARAVAEDGPQPADPVAGAQEGAAQAESPADPRSAVNFGDPRDFGQSVSSLSGRIPIFKNAFITLAREPIRLLRGSLEEDVMSVSDAITPVPFAHFHSAYLQVLVLTGLPGFAIAMAFCFILVKRMLQIFFSEDERVEFYVKVMTLPMAGVLAYCLLEVMIFTTVTIASLLFYLLCGFFLAESHELFPDKK